MEQYFDNHDYGATLKSVVSLWKERLTRPRRFSYLSKAEDALYRFTPGERLVLYLLTTVLSLSMLVMLANLNAAASLVVPTQGGSLVEGATGPVRFINPLLAISQADQDLTALVYSGLMRTLPDGTVVPDLAEGYSISTDGRTYTFALRPDAVFHDGTKITAADVIFTIKVALDERINSPRRADWTGVTLSAPDAKTVVFTLPHAYAPFIDNATLGILPEHLWKTISPEEFPFNSLNTNPIGSGPYQISGVATDSSGSAERYDLVSFSNYTLGKPYLSHISFVFFPSHEALVKALGVGEIDAAVGISSSDIENIKRDDLALVQVPLPRIFGVFFNQSHNSVLADSSVRKALDAASDKDAVITRSLGGHGVRVEGPIPPGLLGNSSSVNAEPLQSIDISTSTSDNSEKLTKNARAILEKGGWVFDPTTPPAGAWKKDKQTLSLSLSTADQPELVSTAKQLAADWRAAGIVVSLQIYPLAQLNTNVIRPRLYDALLFGQVVGPELDLYAFWHSSQRNDPGLNLSMYANARADALLSEARGTTDKRKRNALYEEFASLVVKDNPAVFLYSPDFLYIVPRSILGISLGALTLPADRFAGVHMWYTDTEYVWAMFAKSSR